MLKTVPLVLGGVEKLHEEVVYFMQMICDKKKWSDKFFHADFYEIVVKESPKLYKNFKTFFLEFRKLPAELKDELLNEFEAQNQILERCNDNIKVTKLWKGDECKKFAVATRILFKSMYEETLNSKCFGDFAGETIDEQYAKYRHKCESPMCPFCGLEDYVDLHPDLHVRDSYDHYLHRADYPFAAVNFRNLFPMCSTCNSGTKKAKDILFEADKVTRRRAPYPPVDTFILKIEINDALGPEPDVNVLLDEAADGFKEEKFKTWLSVFSIKARYAGRINKKKQDWLFDALVKIQDGGLDADLQKKLEEARDEAIKSLEENLQSALHLKVPFLTYCAVNVDPLTAFLHETPKFEKYIQNRAGSLLQA